jgi:antitoxin HicB
MSDLRYSMLIQWSEEDQAYLVTLPDWEGRVFGPVTHGDTYEEAAERGKEALEALIAWTQKHGEAMPAPHGYTPAEKVEPAVKTAG